MWGIEGIQIAFTVLLQHWVVLIWDRKFSLVIIPRIVFDDSNDLSERLRKTPISASGLKLVCLQRPENKPDSKFGLSVLDKYMHKFLEQSGQPVAFDSILQFSLDDVEVISNANTIKLYVHSYKKIYFLTFWYSCQKEMKHLSNT